VNETCCKRRQGCLKIPLGILNISNFFPLKKCNDFCFPNPRGEMKAIRHFIIFVHKEGKIFVEFIRHENVLNHMVVGERIYYKEDYAKIMYSLLKAAPKNYICQKNIQKNWTNMISIKLIQNKTK